MFVVNDRTSGATVGDLSKKIVALVIYEDECGEILNLDLPDCFHAEFRIFEELDFLDAPQAVWARERDEWSGNALRERSFYLPYPSTSQ